MQIKLLLLMKDGEPRQSRAVKARSLLESELICRQVMPKFLDGNALCNPEGGYIHLDTSPKAHSGLQRFSSSLSRHYAWFPSAIIFFCI